MKHKLVLQYKTNSISIITAFKIVKGNLKKDCHKREILGYPPALPPADSDTIYSFSGQSRL